MFKINDFADIFCCSKRTIEAKVQKLVPLLKIAGNTKRKHFYTIEEAQYIIRNIGIPPDNQFNRNLMLKFPNLF